MSYYTKLALFVLLLVMPLTLHGQASATGLLIEGLPRVELGANYTYIHANAPPGQCGCFSLNGGSGVVMVNLTPKWAGVADLEYAKANNVNGTTQNITIFNYLFGPRYYWRNHTRYVVYGQALLGGAKESVNFDFVINRMAFGMSGGGGVTTRLSRKFDWNIVQIDYIHTRIPNGRNNSQNDTRVVTGINYKF